MKSRFVSTSVRLLITRVVLLAAVAGLPSTSQLLAQTLRIVTYNIDADTANQTTTPYTPAMGGPISGQGLINVLQGIGDANLAGNARPVDVLALQELYRTPSVTLSYIATQLNGIYGAGTYAYDTTNDPTSGNSLTGNGPSGLIYNTHTVRDLSAVSIGNPSGSGAPRAPIRYHLEAVGSPVDSSFYLYVSHAKAGSDSSSQSRRGIEGTLIRNDATSLGASAHIIYSGDFNTTQGSADPIYQNLISAGIAQATDPANPAHDFTNTSAYRGLFSETATSLSSRLDFQLVTSPVINDIGLQLVPGSYATFGNGGNIASRGSVTSAANSSWQPLLPNRSLVLTSLTTATDHLPIVADYVVVVPEPTGFALLILGTATLVCVAVRRRPDVPSGSNW